MPISKIMVSIVGGNQVSTGTVLRVWFYRWLGVQAGISHGILVPYLRSVINIGFKVIPVVLQMLMSRDPCKRERLRMQVITAVVNAPQFL